MNEILKKRIEIASDEYSNKKFWEEEDYYARECMDIIAPPAFVAGAEYALQNQWISVEEALPTRYTFVVTADKYGHLNFAQVDEKGLWFGNSYPVAYWMPIPELKLNCNG